MRYCGHGVDDDNGDDDDDDDDHDDDVDDDDVDKNFQLMDSFLQLFSTNTFEMHAFGITERALAET